MPSEVWGEITYPFPNFNSAAIGVCNYLSMLEFKLIHVTLARIYLTALIKIQNWPNKLVYRGRTINCMLKSDWNTIVAYLCDLFLFHSLICILLKYNAIVIGILGQ